MQRLLIAFVVVAVGCKREQPPAPELETPTPKEAEDFAHRFAKSMSPCDARAVDSSFDLDALVKRSVGSRKVPDVEVRGLRSGIGSMGGTMCASLVEGTSYTFLRVQTIDGQPRPIFRMLVNNGLNYHSVVLDKSSGRIQIADFYNYLSGELMSETIGNALDLALNDERSGMGAMAIRGKQIRSFNAAGKHKEALSLIHELPAEARKSKLSLMLEIGTLEAMNDEGPELLDAIHRFETAFPNDPALDLVTIDSAFLHQKYDDVLGLLDRLDKRVGGDPYLDTMRASAQLAAKRFAQATASAKRATERDPTQPEAWWMLLTTQTAASDFEAAVRTLDVLRDRFKGRTDRNSLESDARFITLAASREYAAWLAKR